MHLVLFFLEVKRELKRIYIDGCQHNERLNAETDLEEWEELFLSYALLDAPIPRPNVN
jgi:hypothetical protein